MPLRFVIAFTETARREPGNVFKSTREMALVEESRCQSNFRKRHGRLHRHERFGFSDSHLSLKFARSRAERSFECSHQVNRMNIRGLCQNANGKSLNTCFLDLFLDTDKPRRNSNSVYGRRMLSGNVYEHLE